MLYARELAATIVYRSKPHRRLVDRVQPSWSRHSQGFWIHRSIGHTKRFRCIFGAVKRRHIDREATRRDGTAVAYRGWLARRDPAATRPDHYLYLSGRNRSEHDLHVAIAENLKTVLIEYIGAGCAYGLINIPHVQKLIYPCNLRHRLLSL